VKAARYDDDGVHVLDVPVPEPGRDEALVHITSAGVCHSDLHIARGEWARLPKLGLIGHEAIGIVEALGPGAERYFAVGDRVILGLGGVGGYWCGACEYCLGGVPQSCPESRPVLGTFAEYFSIWAPALVKLPDDVGDLDAPLACGGLTAYGAVKKLTKHGILPGRPVAVVGAAGGLGHYAVQLATSFGYEVVAVDVGSERLDFARSLGASVAVDAAEALDEVRGRMGGVDAVLVFSPRLAGFQLALQLLRRGGLFVGVGIPATSEGEIRIDPFEFLFRNPTLVYSATGTVQDMRELVDLAAAGRVTTHVSRVGPLSELGAIFDELAAGQYLGRAVVNDLAN